MSFSTYDTTDRGLPRIMAMAALAVAFMLDMSSSALAGEADVVEATFSQAADGSYRFDVAVRHADAGWDHYADKWQVIGADGAVYGERVLAHPHDDEQPFTRSQSGIVIPDGVTTVTLRAHDKVHGWGGAELAVDLAELSTMSPAARGGLAQPNISSTLTRSPAASDSARRMSALTGKK